MWWINAQAYGRLTISQSNKKRPTSVQKAVTNNSSGQTPAFVVSTSKNRPAHCTDFTFKCALISFGSLSGDAAYASPFFDRMGSIDLLNSSSSIMMLVSSFSFSKPIFVESRRQTVQGEQLVTVRRAPDSAVPRPVRKSAQRGAEETQQAHSHIPVYWTHYEPLSPNSPQG